MASPFPLLSRTVGRVKVEKEAEFGDSDVVRDLTAIIASHFFLWSSSHPLALTLLVRGPSPLRLDIALETWRSVRDRAQLGVECEGTSRSSLGARGSV